jgi:hypothetical protein
MKGGSYVSNLEHEIQHTPTIPRRGMLRARRRFGLARTVRPAGCFFTTIPAAPADTAICKPGRSFQRMLRSV